MKTNELPEEMLKMVSHATKRRDALRADLLRTLKTIGLEGGYVLQSERLGLYAKVVQAEKHRIDRGALVGLGVPDEIIDKATVTKKTRPHVRVGHIADLSYGADIRSVQQP